VAFKFILTGIPAGAKITKAEMALYAYAVAPGSSTTLKNGSKSIYKITAAWAENTIKWTGAPAASSTALATSSNAALNTWETFDVTSDIKSVIETGAANNGYLLRFPTYNYGIKYRSSEYTTAANKPKLTVTYEPATSVQPKSSILPKAESYNVRVTNIQGREILSFVAKDIRQINSTVNTLPSGLHIVQISVPNLKFNYKVNFVK